MNGQDKHKITHSFDKIALFPDAWDQNKFYQNLLLKYIPKTCSNALDIGCGTGEFTARLSKVAQKVTGIDLSERMIQEAKKRHAAENIDYQVADFEQFDPRVQFDLIVSIATLHHLDLAKVLRKIDTLLTENGTLIILDLYYRSFFPGIIFDILALALNSLFLKTKRRSNPVSKEETEAWQEHRQIDKYLTFKELRKIYTDCLGKIKIKRLLFWRYLLVYKKLP